MKVKNILIPITGEEHALLTSYKSGGNWTWLDCVREGATALKDKKKPLED